MQFDSADFVRLADAVLGENGGALTQRPSYKAMSEAAMALVSFREQLLPSLTAEHALLFISATASDTVRYGPFMREMWQKILINTPNEQTIEILKALRVEELKGTLIPFFYEHGNKGSVACYVAAQLSLTITAESVSYFLSARSWSLTNLINLACLIEPGDAPKISAKLEALSAENSFENAREIFSEFRYMLLNSNDIRPLVPDLDQEELAQSLKALNEAAAAAEETANLNAQASAGTKEAANLSAQASASTKEAANLSAQASAGTRETANLNAQASADTKETTNLNAKANADAEPAPKTAAEAILSAGAEFSKKIDNLFDPSNQYTAKIILAVKPYLFSASIAVLLAVALVLIFATHRARKGIEEAEKIHKTAQQDISAPQNYISASTNKKITQTFLKADKYFRMGQLYLLRDQYANALKMYEEALSIDKEHLEALIQSGFCHLQLKNYREAEKRLKKAIGAAPKSRAVNLYLARAYLGENDIKAAQKHYKAEYNMHKDISTGMEYANFLAKYVNRDEAVEFVGNLQALYPNKALMLASDQISGGES